MASTRSNLRTWLIGLTLMAAIVCAVTLIVNSNRAGAGGGGESGTVLAAGGPVETPAEGAAAPEERVEQAGTEGFRRAKDLFQRGDFARAAEILQAEVDAGRSLPASLVYLAAAQLENNLPAAAREAALRVEQVTSDEKARREARAIVLHSELRSGAKSAEALAAELSGDVLKTVAQSVSGRILLAELGESLLSSSRAAQAAPMLAGAIETLAAQASNGPIWPRIESLVELLERANQKTVFRPAAGIWKTIYKIQSGDSLERIARRFHKKGRVGFGVGFLAAVNGIPDPSKISAGKPLRIPDQPLRIDVYRDARAVLIFAGSHLVRAYPCAVGRKEAPTPLGEYVIAIKDRDPIWYRPGKPPIAHEDPDNPLGKGWLGFENKPECNGYGIHGTNDEASIGKGASDGCIRLRNRDIIELMNWLPDRGTRVRVL